MNLEQCFFNSNNDAIANVANVLLDLLLVPVVELLGPKIQLLFDVVLVQFLLIVFDLLIFVRTWDILFDFVRFDFLRFKNDITDLVLFDVRVLYRVQCICRGIIKNIWLLKFKLLHKDVSDLLSKCDAEKLWDFLAYCSLTVEERILVHAPACRDYVHWPFVQHHSVFRTPKLQQVLIVDLIVSSLGFGQSVHGVVVKIFLHFKENWTDMWVFRHFDVIKDFIQVAQIDFLLNFLDKLVWGVKFLV